MRNTLQEQYNLLKEGKMNKQHFFKSARHLFPDLITPTNSFTDAVTILKNRGIISEGIGGLVTTGKKQDWHAIFNENMDKLKEDDNEDKLNQAVKYYLSNSNYLELEDVAARYGVKINDLRTHLSSAQGKAKSGDSTQAALQGIGLFESKEVKAIEKETTKEVTDMATRGYDYKDEKNYDNVFGQEFLQGYYTEMKDPKNVDKHVNELRAIVAKNLAKDCNYYVKNGQFGVKGLGYTTEAPGLGEPKEAKGPFKSSGYGDLKESVLRLAIQDIIKEILKEEIEYARWKKNNQSVKVLKKKIVFDIEDAYGEKYYNVDIDQFTSEDPNNPLASKDLNKPITEALDKGSIKKEGEDAKEKAMKRRITNEIVRRKKKMKALQTLTELDGEENGDNAKKLKELQSEIKQLEGMMGKLDGKKKVKETTVISPGTPSGKIAQIAKDEGATTDAVKTAIDDANQTGKAVKVTGKGV